MHDRRQGAADRLLTELDQALRTVLLPASARRPSPALQAADASLSTAERRHAAGLMRVNHAGEVMAQGLYQGQALTARLEEVRDRMEEAAREETDHLAWCEQRLAELASRPSRLNPVWYAGAFLLGAGAGLAGDRWSLGFVSETEDQVVAHLDGHLGRLPPADHRSRAIVEQMKSDEARHGEQARQAGGEPLPAPARLAMRLVSRLMTRTAYWF